MAKAELPSPKSGKGRLVSITGGVPLFVGKVLLHRCGCVGLSFAPLGLKGVLRLLVG